jgi:hypothetical protein
LNGVFRAKEVPGEILSPATALEMRKERERDKQFSEELSS